MEDRKITRDQVVLILEVFNRYLPVDDLPRVSRDREMKQYAMLYELMEVASLEFEDNLALDNGTPPMARNNLK